MGIRCRGIDEIKTLAMMRGSGVHSSERHVRLFQVASLELERSRRMKERQANLRRVQEIDSKLREIDNLLAKHNEALGLVSAQGAEARPAEPIDPRCDRHVLRY